MLIGYYSRLDSTKEIISSKMGVSRLQAAKNFAARKQLDLKTFLKLFAVKKII